jgi:molybdopterin synthase sulfur carrier subunit
MKILYFASLKEALKITAETLEIQQPISVQQLRVQLAEKHGAQHFPDNILCAVNHQIAHAETVLKNGDEVAFYPPVTGG